jgi:hypothetical protein
MPINIANAVHLETIVKGESEVLDVMVSFTFGSKWLLASGSKTTETR